jgi:hypothetical protein
MPLPESAVAALTANEPVDGTHLVVQDWSGYMRVIWREDRNGKADARWFTSHDEEPLTLRDQIKDAMAVYALGEKLAEF